MYGHQWCPRQYMQFILYNDLMICVNKAMIRSESIYGLIIHALNFVTVETPTVKRLIWYAP